MRSTKLRVATRVMGTALAGAGLWYLSACALVSNLIPPIDLNLSGSNAEFSTVAGVPTQKTIHFSAVEVPVNLSGGSLEIDPSAITIQPGGTGGGKSRVAAQSAEDVQACLDACTGAGVEAADCAQVCEEGEILVRVSVGAADAIDESCDNGVEYEFRVTLDDQLQVDTITATPSSLDPDTLDLIESGAEIGVCIEVLSPVTGTVTIEAISLRVRL